MTTALWTILALIAAPVVAWGILCWAARRENRRENARRTTLCDADTDYDFIDGTKPSAKTVRRVRAGS